MEIAHMKRAPWIVLLPSILLASTNLLCEPGGIALVNCNLFDGVDNRVQPNVMVITRGRQIERIVQNPDSVPAGHEIMDCGNNYLMPGLFDVHTHLETLEQAERALVSGVTTVRSASVSAYQDVGLR